MKKSKTVLASEKMSVNGLTCTLHMPYALKSRTDSYGNEVAQSLPPSSPVRAYVVDEYNCPDNWMHGSAKASSYFLAITEGKGAWLDFNDCRKDKYDVAVLVSIQGVNSVTGQKTDKMSLEQYRAKCPVHDVDFQQDRFCPECKYKWPAQNYLATTGTPDNYFWLDGFRSKDGVVRQYVFTADEARGVASKKIGNDRVFAIGIAFFRSKQPKPLVDMPAIKCSGQSIWGIDPGPGGQHVNSIQWIAKDTSSGVLPTNYSAELGMNSSGNSTLYSSGNDSGVVFYGCGVAQPEASYSPAKKVKTSCGILRGFVEKELESFASHATSAPVEKITVNKNYEIAAGARIDQEVYLDPKDLDYWEEVPSGMLYVNYANEEDVKAILAGGKREEKEEGMLDEIPFGNP